jgi:Gas vesicle synthesis protein GvpL/GvpF
MIHLYGIVEPHVACVGLGLGGEPLQPISCGDVVALTSEHAHAVESPPSEDELWEHEGVLEAMLETGAVLPVRFGVRFSDREAVRAALQPRSAELAAMLADLRDKVELSVRLLAPEPAASRDGIDTAAGPGTRYLLAQLGEQRAAERKLDMVRSALTPFAVDERCRLLPRPGTLATAAFLVERHAVESFSRAVRELDDQLEDIVLVCTGPWPAYNFVDAPLGQAA